MATVDSEVGELGLERDLPNVACHAAIELDNLLLDQPFGTDNIGRLISMISESIPQQGEAASAASLWDPSTVVVVNRAIGDSNPNSNISTIDDLVKEAKDIFAEFSELVENPMDFRQRQPEKVAEMRQFCLALSRRASAAKKSPYSRMPEHPFRR